MMLTDGCRFGYSVNHAATGRDTEGQMDTYAIETGMQPPARHARRKGSKYPIAKLAEGESFFVPTADANIAAVRKAVWDAKGVPPGARFSVRKVDGGTRVWRLA